MAASPRFRAYDEEFKAVLKRISLAFYGCQLAYMATLDAHPRGETPGSPAELDRNRLLKRGRAYSERAPALISMQSYFYMAAAGDFMRGLGALYDKEEVMTPPPALVRCVLEHSARISWLLAPDGLSAEDRLARAYLDLLLSALERKKTAGRIMGKDSEPYAEATTELTELREEAGAVFGEKILNEDGQHTIRGQCLPGLEDAVADMLRRLKAHATVSDHRGIYDYLSNNTHPTFYTHIERWEVIEVDGKPNMFSTVTTDEHLRRAALPVATFCDALNHLISYQRLIREPYEQLVDALDSLFEDAATG